MPVDAVILAGPTASGKTDLLDSMFGAGVVEWLPRLCDAWGIDLQSVHVLSADSMQAYRFMDIGTAKPDSGLRKRLVHHLIDIKNPDEQYTAGEFVARADALCTELAEQHILPVVSGGTGFYLRNFICGLPSAPPSSPEIRAQVAQELERAGTEALRAELARADPEIAAKIHEHDVYRLTRAVEILRSSGKPPSSFAPHKAPRKGKRFVVLGVTRPRDELLLRIHARVDAMMKAGLAEEVAQLMARGYSRKDPGMQAIGYREFFELPGRPLEIIFEAIELHTRQYAKRQMTFFRALPGIQWILPEPEQLFQALAEAASQAGAAHSRLP